MTDDESATTTALKFYGDFDNWLAEDYAVAPIDHDAGALARAALQNSQAVPEDGTFYALVGLSGDQPHILAGTGTTPDQAQTAGEQWILATLGVAGFHGARIQVVNHPPAPKPLALEPLLLEARRRMRASGPREPSLLGRAEIAAGVRLVETLLQIIKEQTP